MKFNLINILANIIFLPLTAEDKAMAKKIKKKQDELEKYGGRMKVIGRGTLIHEFDTKEGEVAYWKMIREKANQRAIKSGHKSIEDFVEKNN